MNKLTISVAMATYNGARFIKEQLDSFARQTLLPTELVACDDGSNDGTLEILNQFAAKAPFPVRIYRNEARLGYRGNFLHALELCRGDLVAFSDQDDVWLPDKLTVCAGEFESESTHVTMHLATLADSNLEPLGSTWPYISRFGSKPLALWDLLNFEFTGSTMVFRRQVAEPLMKNSLIKQAFSGHDLAVGFLAGASGTVSRRKQILGIHRCHDQNVSVGHEVVAAPALAYIRGTRGARSSLLSATHWVKAHTGVASGVKWDTYAKEAQNTASRAEIFLHAAEGVDEPLRSVLKQASGLLRKRATSLAERSLLYRGTPGKAHARFCRMVLQGRYRVRNAGGLGFWSLGKDISLLFRSSRPQTGYKKPDDRKTWNSKSAKKDILPRAVTHHEEG